MSERFERLFSLPSNLYSEDSPVILTAGALLKDTQTGSIIAQLKFQSLSATPIKALKISINAYDVASKPITGVEDYQYLDLMISNGQSFGSNKAIVMPNTATRSFAIGGITVVLTDGTVKNNAAPMTALPKAVPLEAELNRAELENQYKLAVNQDATYIPQEVDGLWMCSCGEWNSGDSCVKCRAKKSIVFSAYDIPLLTEKANSRLAQEKAQRDEQERLAEIAKKEQTERDSIAAEKQKAVAKKAKFVAVICLSLVVAVLVFALWLYPDVIQAASAYNEAVELLENGHYEDAISAFVELGDYKDATKQVSMTRYIYAEELLHEGRYMEAIEEFNLLGTYGDARQRSLECWSYVTSRATICAGGGHTVGIKTDNTVTAVGANNARQCNVNDWTDIIAVSAGFMHTIGLKSDGTLVATGDNGFGQCDVASWEGIVNIAAGNYHTLGLKVDGTVVAVGDNEYGQCDVERWTDIVAVAAGESFSIGLKSNGTVVAVGSNEFGQCDTINWSDITTIAAGWNHSVGLKSTGKAVAAGIIYPGCCKVDAWENIAVITAGGYHTVGVQADGTVVAVGLNDDGQTIVSEWKDIVAISAGSTHTVGLMSDGTLVATGWNDHGQCNVGNWTDIKTP